MVGTKSQVKQASFLLRYFLQAFGTVLILAVLIRTFVLSSFVMSGSAMLPSIWPGDFLVAAKWGMVQLERGEIVALRCPQSRDTLCLKRVVGLPGDRVEIREGHLVLNGQQAIERPAGPFAVETIGADARAIWPESSGGNLPPVVVPPQTVFLLNDKRSDQEDSRIWGPVSAQLLEARIVRVWMSLDWYDGEKVRSWPRIRWSRLFRSIN